MNCPRCQATNRASARFCYQCGLWLEETCPVCGSELMAQAIFCDRCGNQVTPLPAKGNEWQEREEGGALHIEVAPHAEGPQPSAAEPASTETLSPASPLQKYIPKELMARLERARVTGGMAGERRVVTMLFCDVKGSTAAAEQLDPEEWTEIINGAFEFMILPIYDYEGTVARLMGDGILAFFGAPIAHEDDPQRAVLAGLDIVAGIGPYRAKMKERWGIDITVRVGINTGLVVVGAVGSDLRMEYTAMGDAINLAARMEQAAEPGTVQIAHATYKVVKPYFEVEALGGIEVKGKEEAVPAYRVLGRKEMVGQQRGIEGLHAPMVGRKRELGSLTEVLEGVQQGVGHIVSLIGQAGLGKSRLIKEAKLSAEDNQGIVFWEAASLSYEVTRPYGLFRRLLRKMFEIAPSDPAQLAREKLESAAADLGEGKRQRTMRVLEALFNLEPSHGEVPLEGEAFKRELFQIMPLLWREQFGQRPTVLIFEDIHWSDPASIELLLQLLTLTAEISLVLLCSYRPERSGPVWQLRTTADERFHHRYTEINLRPLTASQVDELVNALLNNAALPDTLRQRIQERASGNPFFVEEVVRSLIDSGAVVAEEQVENGQRLTRWRASEAVRQIDIPDSLQSLLAARIDRLREETREVLQIASVIGRSFYERVLLAVAISDSGTAAHIEEEVNRLLQLEMIREVARLPELEYKFSNPLTQEVAYQTILLKQRREFHQRVARAMEALFPEQLAEMASQLANHFREGGEPEAAVKYLAVAGDAAFRLYANKEAVAHYDEALALIPDVEVEADLLRQIYTNRGRALELVPDYQAAVANYEWMEEEAERRKDDGLRLGALIGRTIIHSTLTPVFEPDVGLPLAQQALALADELGEHASKAEVLWGLMIVHANVFGEFEKAAAYGREALALCREHDLETRLPYVLNDLGRVIGFVGQIDEGSAMMLEARPLFEAQNNLPLMSDNSSGLALLFSFAGQMDEALVYARDALQISQRLDNPVGIRNGVARLNGLRLDGGEIGQAIVDLEKLINQHYEEDDVVVFAMPTLALAYGSLRCTGRFWRMYYEERPRAERLGPLFRDYFLAPLAWILALENRIDEAAETVGQLSFDALQRHFLPLRAMNFMATGQLMFSREQYDEVVDLAAQAADEQVAKGFNFMLGDLLLLEAEALLAMDPPREDEARRVLQEARRTQEAIGSTRVMWLILAVLADLADEEEALQLRREALRIIESIAGDIADDTLRQEFMNGPHVTRVMAALDG